MALAPGAKFGPYEVIDAVGAGGMGEVYRARDSRLDRVVAIKVLPGHLSSDPDLKARFEREAKAISSFQHPHICTLYDVGSQDGFDFLVMEFVEGETLSTRLQRGAMPLKELLRCGTEIAEALEAAHRRGIVHRDLKPGNVMLTSSGAKLLDFGLAKPLAVATGSTATAPAFSAVATMTSPVSPITQQGKVVGTVQYMSPEQVEGKEADPRSDIFALGCVLYEMATGKRAFEGKSNLSIASAILEKDPEPITAIQPLTPPALDHVIQRALAKSPEDRWQSATDVRGELQWISSSSSHIAAQKPSRQKMRWSHFVPWAIAALALAGLLLTLWRSRQAPMPALLHANILPPTDGTFAFYGDIGSEPALSPDGKNMAFAAIVNGTQNVYVRELSSETPRLLSGSERGSFPFWSPDGKQLGYFANGQLLRTDIASGSSISVTAVAQPRGASWAPDGTIVFAPTFRAGISVVSVAGGEVRQITQVDPALHTSHRWPVFLPDGEHFVYLAINHRAPTSNLNALYVGSVHGGNPKRLVSSLCNAVVADSRLFFCRDNKLFVQSMDLQKFELKGEPQLVVTSILTDPSTWRAPFSATNPGLLVYAPGASFPGSELVWFDRNGKRLGRHSEVRDYMVLASSHNGKKLAVELSDSSIWVGETNRKSLSRLTFAGTAARQPVLSPDGSQVAFASDVGGKIAIVRKSTSGLGSDEILMSDQTESAPNDWSPDGRYLLIQQGEGGKEEYGVFALQLFGERKLIPFLHSPKQQAYDAVFSPDMRWIAYTAPENGREEVFVSPFDPNVDPKQDVVRPAGRFQISNGGGAPHWSHDGRQIFYLAGDGKVMSVAVRATASSFDADPPTELFPVSFRNILGVPYAVLPDGRFLVNTSLQPLSSPIHLVTDWHQLLKP